MKKKDKNLVDKVDKKEHFKRWAKAGFPLAPSLYGVRFIFFSNIEPWETRFDDFYEDLMFTPDRNGESHMDAIKDWVAAELAKARWESFEHGLEMARSKSLKELKTK